MVLDACAFMNLVNSGCLPLALTLDDVRYAVSSAVRREVISEAGFLSALIDAGAIAFIDDSQIPADMYLELKAEYELGDGETEIICVAKIDQAAVVVVDDRKARTAASTELGEKRVTGSIGILRRCVARDLIGKEDAYNGYLRMKNLGGYLPELSIDECFPQSLVQRQLN